MLKRCLLTFLKGIGAGLAIGIGGFLFVVITAFVQGEVGKALGSIAFSIGLFTVCTFGLSLYTGKIGMVYEKKQETAFYIDLPIMLLGNAIGAFGLGFLLNLPLANTDVVTRAIEVANSRLNFATFDHFLATMIKAFCCGVCVYLSVACFKKAKSRVVGTLLLMFFVFLFVYFGFEHCIANMFYFGLANRIEGYTFLNLALVIIFNSLGPIPAVLLFKLAKE